MKIVAVGSCLAIVSAVVTLSGQAPTARCQLSGHLSLLPEVWEASGGAVGSASPPRLWVINDSEEPVVYGTDNTGRIVERVRVAGAVVQDWEDLAIGPCPAGRCLFIADIGDNSTQRPRITIYRIPEPQPGVNTSAPADAFHATYPDGPHNAESLVVDPEGRMFVITKGRTADVYRFPSGIAPNSTSMLENIGRVRLAAGTAIGDKRDHGTTEHATGAALSTDRKWLAIRSNRSVWFFRANDFLAGTPGDPLWVDVSGAREPQGEAIAFGPDGTIYLVGEGGGKNRPGTMTTMNCALPQ